MSVSVYGKIDATEAEEWQEQAACRGADVDKFFSLDEEDQRQALELCARCPVREPCLEYALREREMYGIWGGVLEPDRRTLIRDLRRHERELAARRRSQRSTSAA